MGQSHTTIKKIVENFSSQSIKPVNCCFPWYKNCRSITVLLMSPKQISITCFNWGTVISTLSDLQICIKLGQSTFNKSVKGNFFFLWFQSVKENTVYTVVTCESSSEVDGYLKFKASWSKRLGKDGSFPSRIKEMEQNNKSFSVPHWLKLSRPYI